MVYFVIDTREIIILLKINKKYKIQFLYLNYISLFFKLSIV